jgi:hypothetical protein
MSFDLQGARDAGYSDAEIASFLGQQAGFDTSSAVKSGYQPGEIIGFLSDRLASSAPQPDLSQQPAQGDPMGSGFAETAQPPAPAEAGGGRGFVNPPLASQPQPKPVIDRARRGTTEIPAMDVAGNPTGQMQTVDTVDDPDEVGAVESFGRGWGKAGAGAGKTLTAVPAAPIVAAEAVANAITGSSDTKWQDWYFRSFLDPVQSAQDWYALKPEQKQSVLAKVSEGLGAMTQDLPQMIASGGLGAEGEVAQHAQTIARFLEQAVSRGFDAMRPIMVKSGTDKAQEVLDAGGSPAEAANSALTAALVTGFQGAQPMSAEGGVIKRLATGFPVGVAQGEGARVVQNAADPEALRRPFDAEGAIVEGATGALAAGAMGHAGEPVHRSVDVAREADRFARPSPDVLNAGSVDEAIEAAQIASNPEPGSNIRAQMLAIRPLESADASRETAVPAEAAGADRGGLPDGARGLADGAGSTGEPAHPVAAEPAADRAEGGPVPSDGTADAVGELEPRPASAIEAQASGITARRNDSGTLTVAGERQAVAELLRAHDVPFVPSAEGAVVGRSHAADAERAVQDFQPRVVTVTTPEAAANPGKVESDSTSQVRQAPKEAAQDNPFKTFLIRNGIALRLAKDFTPGTKERLAMGRTFRHDGLELDSLAERAAEAGYIRSRDDTDALYDLVARVASGERVAPMYGRDGEQDLRARVERQRAIEQEAAENAAHDFGLSPQELDEVGYIHDTAAVQARVRALVALAEAHGMDAESILEDAAKLTQNGTDHDFLQAARHAVEATVARRRDAGAGDRGEDSGQEGAAPAHREEGQDGLSRPSADDVVAQQERAQAGERAEQRRRADEDSRAQADAELPDFTLTGSSRAADANPRQSDLLSAPDVGRIEDLGEKIGGARKDTAESTGTRAVREPADERPTWAKRYAISQVAAGDGEGRWVIDDKRTSDFMGRPTQVGGRGHTFATKAEAEAYLPLAALSLKHRAIPARDGKYEIWRDITDRKRVKVVDHTFETREQALEYMAQHAVDILETNTSFGESDIPLPPDRARRGPARREGDVAGRDFMDAFGFRGVEFGNWNSQGERQALMNDAYDGLQDLASILGIPPKAVGLNGDLALAFGARGHGLSSARAHYELGRAVINLTKERGAGSLAHEWFHALDHYFGRQDGKASSKWIENADGTRTLKAAVEDNASHGFGRNSAVRPEVREAYVDLLNTIFKKATHYVEDTQKADSFTARAKDDLARELDSLRAELSAQKDPRYYKRNNKPATADQLAQFDAIAQRLLNGEAQALTTDWKGVETPQKRIAYRWTNDALEQLSALHKAVRGRAGFDATNRSGPLDRLSASMRRYSERLRMLADAQAGASKTKMVPTEFAMNAKELDQGRGGDYWTTPHEMAARAFQGFVEDKIAQQGNLSRFLNYGPENAGVLTPWGVKFPFPRGEERQAINAALQRFVDALKTRETDTGTALFKRGTTAERGISEPVFHAQMAKAFGRDVAQRLIERGVVVPIADQSRLPDHVVPFVRDGDVIFGFYDPRTDRTYAVLSNLKPEMVKSLALHEVGVHYGFEEMLGKDKYNQVIRRLSAMGKAGHEAVIEAKAQAKENSSHASQVPEETLAYLVTNHPELGLVREVIARIKAFLFREFGMGGKHLTADDMVMLARAAVLHSSRTEPGARAPDFAAQFSREQRTVEVDGQRRPVERSDGRPILADHSMTKLRAFWKWFGASKVVDEQGRPLVVYHGTTNGDINFAGRERGIFFTDSTEKANGYTVGSFVRGGHEGAVYPAYVSMKNPLVIDALGKRNDNIPVPWQPWKPKVFGNLPAGAVSVEGAFKYAMAHGHDGLIVRNVIDTHDIHARDKGSVYAVASPEQIKSATGNRGTFDAGNPDIRFARTQTAEDAETEPKPHEVAPYAGPGAKMIEGANGLMNHVYMALAPMSAGDTKSQAGAQQFVNDVRAARFQWQKMSTLLKAKFSRDEREQMWSAADEENDLRRETASNPDLPRPPGQGLDRLTPRQREAVQTLHEYADALWQRAKSAGLVEGEGVAFWTPRTAVMIGEDGTYSRLAEPGKKATSDGTGRNVVTTAPSMLGRKHETTAESEAALKAKKGENATYVRDILTMPLAMSRFEQAIAGRELINTIKDIGLASGKDLVSTTGGAGFFTLDHPAFSTFRPRMVEGEDGKWTALKDENGRAVLERAPLFIDKSWEGPLKAVMSTRDSAIYTGYMLLKSKAMSAIMYSPLIHNQVIFGRAMGYTNLTEGGPLKTIALYFTGHAAKQDNEFMRTMIRAGMVPIGEHNNMLDATDIAADRAREGTWLDPNESWFSIGASKAADALGKKVLDPLLTPLSERAGIAASHLGRTTREALDAAGDFWHNTLLWRRVGDLQAGIARDAYDKLTAKGIDADVAAVAAAHLANRYAGAVGHEDMSKFAHMAANGYFFSKSFNVANIGTVKDAAFATTAGRKALIRERSESPEEAAQVESFLKSKARFGLARDLAYSIIAVNLATLWFQRDKDADWTVDSVTKGLSREVDIAMKMYLNWKDHPTELSSYDPRRLSGAYDNEPGKQNRVFMGLQESGRAQYMRLPMGKVIEDLIGWTTEFAKTADAKKSPFMRALDVARNKKDDFGTPIWDERDPNFAHRLADAAMFLLGTHAPVEQLKTLKDMASGVATPLDKEKTLGNITGLTVSQGHPGGPEAGVAAEVEQSVKGSQQHAMDEVKRLLKYGKADEAYEVLEKSGLTPREIGHIIQRVNDPKAVISRSTLKKFNAHATDEERRRLEEVTQ